MSILRAFRHAYSKYFIPYLLLVLPAFAIQASAQKKNGEEIVRFHDDGPVKSRTNYKLKQYHGTRTLYNYDGTMYSTTEYENGLRQGWHRTNERDSTITLIFYSQDSIRRHIAISRKGDTTSDVSFKYTHAASGKLIQKYRYHGNSLINRITINDLGRDSIIETHTGNGRFAIYHSTDSLWHLNRSLDGKPEFRSNFADFIGENLRYPEQARDYEITGEVIVTFMVNADGSVSNIRATGPMNHPSLEAEAIRHIRVTQKQWKPATLADGTPLSMDTRIVISFTIEDH